MVTTHDIKSIILRNSIHCGKTSSRVVKVTTRLVRIACEHEEVVIFTSQIVILLLHKKLGDNSRNKSSYMISIFTEVKKHASDTFKTFQDE